MNETRIRGMTANLLIVDDAPENLDVLSGMLLRAGYNVRPVTSGRAALRSMRTYPPDLVLLDVNLGDMNGFELCEHMKRDAAMQDIPVLFISGLVEAEDKIKAFSIGGVDYITKPFNNEEVLARVATHLKLRSLQVELETHKQNLEHLVRLKIAELSESQMATIFALAKLAESRDDDTGRHLERVRALCGSLAERLSRHDKFRRSVTDRFIENIRHAGPLHDIGKVGIPDAILLKPGRLDRDEYEEMKKHTAIGAETLRYVHEKYSRNAFIAMGIDIARHHHERWDGKGYPDGLAGEAIPLSARILTVIDSYDAMRSRRCYKEPVSHPAALAEIARCSGSQFDPDVAAVFLEAGESVAAEWDALKD